MSDIDIRKVVQEELNNIAPEVDMGTVDPAADLRKPSTSTRWTS